MDKFANYKVGDVVRLKSGGPDMTVVKFGSLRNNPNLGYVACDWFVGDKLHRDNFYYSTLEKVNNEYNTQITS